MVTRSLRILGAACALAACSADAPATAQQQAQAPATLAAPSTARQVSAALDTDRRTAIVDATGRVAPSVVSIRTIVRQRAASQYDAFFFGTPREQTSQSFGTGFIIRADGVVLTNQHVVTGGEQITVTLADGTDVEARLLGEDPLTDIAVLKLERSNLPVAPIGRSADLLIGEWAIALGNPYSYLLGNSEPTVTAGVISATGRNILPMGNTAGRYYDMIQTDAAINPGNSGGPLVNALGEVIGVSSSIFSNTGESVGVGFAIPIERAMRVAEELIRNGAVRRAWVGLDVAGPDRMGEWKSAGGVPVVQLVPGGPADRAGLQVGDVLVRANGRTLRNYLDWEAVLLDVHVGDAVEVTVTNRGRTLERRIVPADLPSVTAERVRLRGLDLVSLTPAVRAELGTRVESGAALVRVPTETQRYTGLRDGDVIVRIDYVRDRRLIQANVTSAQDVAAILDRVPRGAPFRLWYVRGASYGYTDLTN
jgi:serine protease Do